MESKADAVCRPGNEGKNRTDFYRTLNDCCSVTPLEVRQSPIPDSLESGLRSRGGSIWQVAVIYPEV